ncbi:MAG: hypothetical protein WDA71_12775 [Actinomycetota bacterium]
MVAGKGMFIWQWSRSGSPAQVVVGAHSMGLSFLVLRASGSDTGFDTKQILADLLPRAHAAGIKVIGYDPPTMANIQADVDRALALARFRAPGGHALDAVAADIEPEASRRTAANYDAYGRALRKGVGQSYPLVAIVYPPNQFPNEPYRALAPHFDAFMPMVYWRAQTTNAAGYSKAAVQKMAAFGLPVSFLGQAFAYSDHSANSLRAYPPAAEIRAALQAAQDAGAIGASFWVWQHATEDFWRAFSAFPFRGAAVPSGGRPPRLPIPAAPPVVNPTPQSTPTGSNPVVVPPALYPAEALGNGPGTWREKPGVSAELAIGLLALVGAALVGGLHVSRS